MTNTENTTQESEVVQFKQRVYTRATEVYGDRAKPYLEELGIAPIIITQFQENDGETVESLNTAVLAKLEELGRRGDINRSQVEQFADELGLERPGTQEVTVRVTFRLSPQELTNLTETGHLPRKQPVRVDVDTATKPAQA